jgi:hypothetical protein
MPVEDLFLQHRRLMNQAIVQNNVDRVRALLTTPYVEVNEAVDSGITPYAYRAFELNHVEIAKILVDAGADILNTWYVPFTPLHSAVLNRGVDALRFLIDFYTARYKGRKKEMEERMNPQCQISGHEGATPLLYVVETFGSKGDTKEERQAVASQMIRLLVDNGADPNAPIALKRNLVGVARVLIGSEIAEYLIANGGHEVT